MNTEHFIAALVLTLGTVGAALLYLRGITRRVLVEQCRSDTGAEFWLRSADVLALAGSLILVLTFGGLTPEAGWVQQLRLVLGLALCGVFAAVLTITRSVWGRLPPADAAARHRTPATAGGAGPDRG